MLWRILSASSFFYLHLFVQSFDIYIIWICDVIWGISYLFLPWIKHKTRLWFRDYVVMNMSPTIVRYNLHLCVIDVIEQFPCSAFSLESSIAGVRYQSRKHLDLSLVCWKIDSKTKAVDSTKFNKCYISEFLKCNDQRKNWLNKFQDVLNDKWYSNKF